MTVKELAYSTQQHLQTTTSGPFKRAHIYELLAAAFGFNSYASFSSDTVFTRDLFRSRRPLEYTDHIKNRCLKIGYDTRTADAVARSLPALLTEQEIDVISIPDLIAQLRDEPGHEEWSEEENEDDWGIVQDAQLAVTDTPISPLLMDGLNDAASKSSATAHYALALIHANALKNQVVGSDYWHQQAQSGRELTGVEQEWAENHAARLNSEQLFSRHLNEAARLGNPEARLDLADRFDDPAFFELGTIDVNADPAWVAYLAERLGRPEDSKKWLTKAATAGDTEAMRQLIEEHDHGDLVRCWTWLHLAEMLGTDLTIDQHQAIHEDGSPYDDDVGGPIFVVGNDGISLAPINAEQQETARQNASELFRMISDNNL